tara:strand:+ start:2069 stop:2698 length:630 start_codon:yes stop_codon:yes gene_type:complete
MEGTTSLDALPTSSQAENNNVQLTTSETNVKIESTVNDMREQRHADIASQGNDTKPAFFDETMSKNFVTGVQKAAESGTLELQTRDVPQDQRHLTQDPQTQPCFVPETHKIPDYIGNVQHKDQIIQQHDEKKKTDENYDIIFNNLQTPLLLAVIYFIFQLPIIKQTSYRLMPYLYKKDGTSNLNGYIVHSVFFAGVYQVLVMTLNYFSI